MRTVYIAIAILLAATPAEAGLKLAATQYYPYDARRIRRHPPTHLLYERYRVEPETQRNDTEQELVAGIQNNCIRQSMEHTPYAGNFTGKRRAYAFTARVDYAQSCMNQMLKKAQKDKRLTNVRFITEVTR